MAGMAQEETVHIFLQTNDFVTFWWYYFIIVNLYDKDIEAKFKMGGFTQYKP